MKLLLLTSITTFRSDPFGEENVKATHEGAEPFKDFPRPNTFLVRNLTSYGPDWERENGDRECRRGRGSAERRLLSGPRHLELVLTSQTYLISSLLCSNELSRLLMAKFWSRYGCKLIPRCRPGCQLVVVGGKAKHPIMGQLGAAARRTNRPSSTSKNSS